MTHLSQATCARIAELGLSPEMDQVWCNGYVMYPEQARDLEKLDESVPALTLTEVLSRDFLIAAFGEWDLIAKKCQRACKEHDGLIPTELGHWHYGPQQQGHKLLEAYWTSGVEGVEELLLELLTDSSPTAPAPK